jgi:subtilisin family serine protease
VQGVADGAVEIYNAKVIGPHADGHGGVDYYAIPVDAALGIYWCAGYRFDNDPDFLAWYGVAPRTVPPVDVINISLGSKYDPDVLAYAVSYALDRGITVVASAGNDYDPEDPNNANGRVTFPAAYPGVLAVGATDRFDAVADWSSRGPELALVAPGVDIVSSLTVESGHEYYGMGQGTSLSTAFVTGAVALQLARTPWRWDLSGVDLGYRVTEQGTMGLLQVPSSVRH